MPYENSDDAERYSDHEERERTEDPEREESDEDLEKEAQEAADDLKRREAADNLANEASDELDEKESNELDDFENNDFDKERSMEDDLGHDLDEARDDLHDRYVNDMERQLEGASTKDVEGDETDSDGSSSEMTESSESYHDAGDGMAYATRTKGGSGEAEAAETEAEEEAQEVSEPEAQEPAESEETEEPVNEKGINRITRHESEEGETTASSETQETPEYNDARTSPEVTEPEEETQEVSEGHSESEPAVSNEDQHDTSELSESMEDTDEGEVTETSEPDVETDDLEQEIEDILESYEEPESELLSHEEHETAEQEMSEGVETESEEQTVEHEAPEQEVSEDPEVETEETEANEVPAEDEPLPETLDEFVERVKKILDERTEDDDAYDYVQDPLTGEIQRVPKILAEYESDEQKQRRKNRNLFAELSEEERERFKELVREDAESEDERSVEAVERAWSQVVAMVEQEREELLEKVRELLEDPEVMQLLEGWSEGEDKRRTNVEYAEDDEVEEDEQFLTRGESRLKLWIPRVNGERVESVEQLEELVRERYPGLMKHKDYPKYLRQAKLHLELVQRFQNEDLKRGDIARIAKEIGQSPVTVKRWLIEGAKPRVYHYLNRNPLDDRAERVAKILESLNGVTDMKTLEKRLRTLFLYEAMKRSKTHARDMERARLFYQFLEEYVKGGMLKTIANQVGIGESTIAEWFSGSQLPSYIRMAVTIPSEQPDTGKKWLPLRLNTQTNLPEQFIQVPDTVTLKEDLLYVLRQLQSLHTPEMKEFEEEYGKESVSLAFMYLLGLSLADGQFDSDSDLSARVVLFASKKYKWSPRLGGAFSYAMGKVGLTVERRTDSTKIRDGKVIECYVWASQASPLLRWVKEVLLGLRPSLMKKQSPIDADWIVNLPHNYRVAFLQGLADGDGHASIKTNRVGIASKPNRAFIKQLFSSLNIHSGLSKTKVEIKRQEDILRASSLPLFRHATSRKKNHDELCEIIRLFKDRRRKTVPANEMDLIRELHEQGLTPGEIAEKLWSEHRIPRTVSSVFKIVKRIVKKKGESET